MRLSSHLIRSRKRCASAVGRKAVRGGVCLPALALCASSPPAALDSPLCLPPALATWGAGAKYDSLKPTDDRQARRVGRERPCLAQATAPQGGGLFLTRLLLPCSCAAPEINKNCSSQGGCMSCQHACPRKERGRSDKTGALSYLCVICVTRFEVLSAGTVGVFERGGGGSSQIGAAQLSVTCAASPRSGTRSGRLSSGATRLNQASA